jgi:hypothetical protein
MQFVAFETVGSAVPATKVATVVGEIARYATMTEIPKIVAWVSR